MIFEVVGCWVPVAQRVPYPGDALVKVSVPTTAIAFGTTLPTLIVVVDFGARRPAVLTPIGILVSKTFTGEGRDISL